MMYFLATIYMKNKYKYKNDVRLIWFELLKYYAIIDLFNPMTNNS